MARFNFILPVFLALSSIAAAVPNFFLQFNGLTLVDTPASTPSLDKVVQIQDFSFDVSVPVTFSPTGEGAGRVSFSAFSFTRDLDGNSPAIFNALTAGKPINTATMSIVQPAASGAAFIQTVYTFTDVFITSQTLEGTAGNAPSEVVGFAYGKLSVVYNQRNADGSKGPTSTGGWNIMTNTPTRELHFTA